MNNGEFIFYCEAPTCQDAVVKVIVRMASSGRVRTLELISETYQIKITGVLAQIQSIELYVPSEEQRDYDYTVPNLGDESGIRIELKVRKLTDSNAEANRDQIDALAASTSSVTSAPSSSDSSQSTSSDQVEDRPQEE